jgi:hypothetical protein
LGSAHDCSVFVFFLPRKNGKKEEKNEERRTEERGRGEKKHQKEKDCALLFAF